MTQCMENLPVYYVPEFYFGLAFWAGIGILAWLLLCLGKEGN